ncbi:sensor domain-containing diguanylate cyclase [Nocardioides rubriscoriae]|uniref:sensor domain-containing diguanylate cyclase n=1 Tax=Nocardioides rubriscoriae TaxID=642762 RepID=UPI0011E007C9|nr:diguanylate cyclase [Nocardioides rubriscoriae]
MTAAPALQEIASLVEGEPRVVLRRLLTLLCEQLGMDTAFASVLDGAGNRTVRLSAHADGTAGPDAITEPLADAWCGRVVETGGFMIGDARDDAALQALPSTSAFGIVSFAGVPLFDESGTVFGTLCALGREPHTSLNVRDHHVLSGLAAVAAPLVRALDAPPKARPTPTGLAAVADAVEKAGDLEGLSRPLLDALGDLTGLASTYLTVVHEDDGVQEIRYARNTRDGFAVDEGLVVPWEDTLCKRSLEEQRPYVTDVASAWPDSAAGRELGIRVYVSVPVTMPDGALWGTLCAADSVSADDAEAHLPTMRLFARLIASEVQREAAVSRARDEADTDSLTGCATRRVVDPWLAAQVALVAPAEVVVVAYVDLDSFKATNDTLGHAAGDAVLVEVGRRLRAAARPHDLVARLGGDEFLVAARLPRSVAVQLIHRVQGALTFSLPWAGTSVDVRASVGAATTDECEGSALAAVADAAMYLVKHSARAS